MSLVKASRSYECFSRNVQEIYRDGKFGEVGNEEVGDEEDAEGYAAFYAYASSIRDTIAMGIPPKSAKMIVYASLIVTGSSKLTTALRMACVRPVKTLH